MHPPPHRRDFFPKKSSAEACFSQMPACPIIILLGCSKRGFMYRIGASHRQKTRGNCGILPFLGNLHNFRLTEFGKMGYYCIIALHGGVVIRRLTQGCADPSSPTRLSCFWRVVRLNGAALWQRPLPHVTKSADYQCGRDVPVRCV